MADVTAGMHLAVGIQAVVGAVNTTIRDLAGALTIANGIVYGDVNSGTKKSGIDYEAVPLVREAQPMPGSRTNAKSVFLREQVGSFTISLPFTGGLNVSSNPVVDTDFDLATHYPGVDATLRSMGLVGLADATGTDAHDYTPAVLGSEQLCSVTLWDVISTTNSRRVTLKDVRCSGVFKLIPGKVVILDVTFRGVLDSTADMVSPTYDYAPQDDQSPQLLEELTVLTWQGTQRSFTDLEVGIDPALEEIDDATGVGGKRTLFGSPRLFTLSGTMIVASADAEAERDAMLEAAGGTGDAYIVGIGIAPPTPGTSRCKAHRHTINGMRPKSVKTVEVGETGIKGIAFTAEASGATASSEYTLTMF